MLRETVKALAEADEGDEDLSESPQELAKLKPRADMLKKALKAYDKQLKQALQEHGTLQVNADTRLTLEERERRSIEPKKALPLLAERQEWETWQDLVEGVGSGLKLSKGKTLKALTRDVEHGGKGKQRKAIEQELEDAGALSVSSYSVVTETPVVEELNDGEKE
jgi:hypothetical protein